ncbi:hypothetical protein H9P43_010020 [Blastocladiella emersonii ATCC 22665]|nr:hypothetical protein H9P43_010020 [Blastocladiella emersonii ATCC 22665]
MADSAAESGRRAHREKEREKMLSEFARKKEQIAKDNEVRSSADRFVSTTADVESQLKMDTVGLVHLDEYRSIRERLEHKRKADGMLGSTLDLAAGDAAGGGGAEPPKKKKKGAAGKSRTLNTAALSFDDDEVLAPPLIAKKRTKDPTVDTSFLPDRQREEEDRRERERLRAEWERQQEQVKQEEITIEYSYWDGNGHRNKVVVKKGDTVHAFLEKVRSQWPDLRGVAADNLIFVKEDLILSHHLTFYDFIINKVRGKSGPIFEFTIRDDVRLVNDATQEIVESHPGKVCQRAWYERNKHIFPASRWEVFDPDKQYAQGGYTFSDRGRKKQ